MICHGSTGEEYLFYDRVKTLSCVYYGDPKTHRIQSLKIMQTIYSTDRVIFFSFYVKTDITTLYLDYTRNATIQQRNNMQEP